MPRHLSQSEHNYVTVHEPPVLRSPGRLPFLAAPRSAARRPTRATRPGVADISIAVIDVLHTSVLCRWARVADPCAPRPHHSLDGSFVALLSAEAPTVRVAKCRHQAPTLLSKHDAKYQKRAPDAVARWEHRAQCAAQMTKKFYYMNENANAQL
ncbi:uncharacterized protein LAESUDRAFT_710804 [Laetiporus sulphureus 93-53]|uniref:Uncharacterized protein n=1 Tax=Laetiporus sulphureus 93-53 TaxID=1314785 RepID=A0A165H4F6_9APHY|nr:uncharacterized protein LAESUDRAFT_710804 [Laetiporus sulphureus 93-53]KZT11229.1 hypothetical protein LAESUDRAFT_710804 [Laetiporus sulphureus 93-53]